MLTMQLLLGHPVQAHPHAGLRAQRDQAKSLGLAVRTVFVELDLMEIGHTNVLADIDNVLVGGPLEKENNYILETLG